MTLLAHLPKPAYGSDMTAIALIVAAGSGSRTGGEIPKQFRRLGHKLVVEWSVEAFRRDARFNGTVLVVSSDRVEWAQSRYHEPGINIIEGGKTRAESVRLALAAIGETPDHVFIHDAARPGLSPAVLDALFKALTEAKAAAPALVVADALKRDNGSKLETVDRENLYRVQTPQAFDFETIRAAFSHADEAFIDDLQAVEATGTRVVLVPGEEQLAKITFPGDLERVEQMMTTPTSSSRIGKGFDVHAFCDGDHVVMCGLKIPHERGLDGHSDADVGWHALTDAILGAAALGDIGDHFPPSDDRWKDADSRQFLVHAVELAKASGWAIGNCDLTIICEAPKIKPHREAMRQATADATGLPLDAVSVKATTTEGLGFTGRAEGIAAEAIVLLQRTNLDG